MNNRSFLGNSGFTLVELMITVAISGIVLAGMIAAHQSQEKTYVQQEQVAHMQQNLRAAMYYMEREIRMAGCDPTGDAGAGFLTADSGTIQFTLDITGGEADGEDNDGDGNVDEADEDEYADGDVNDPNEDVEYTLYDGPDGDGVNDTLGRDTGGGNQPVAENVEALDFVYLDENGNPMATPVSAGDLEDIRAVEITLVVRSNREAPNYVDTTQYENQQGTVLLPPPNDNFRRRRLASRVTCRNMGL